MTGSKSADNSLYLVTGVKKGRVDTRRKQILQLDDSRKLETRRGKKSPTVCGAYMFAEDDMSLISDLCFRFQVLVA